jgi:F0F1-type ATP synthase membrane subunit c/vacuolar-type H+-ATPase subunit K
MPVRRRMNKWVLAAAFCGFLSLGFGPLAAIPAVLVGHKALRQIRRSGEWGKGLAVAALVVAYVILALTVAAFAPLTISRIERALG